MSAGAVDAVRPSWDEYFLGIAEVVSRRSTCLRAACGAVLVVDGRVASTGYNGAPSGEPHCSREGCAEIDGHCQRAVHAELNALLWAHRTCGDRPCISTRRTPPEGPWDTPPAWPAPAR